MAKSNDGIENIPMDFLLEIERKIGCISGISSITNIGLESRKFSGTANCYGSEQTSGIIF